jgi:hypothetical protein
MGRRMKEEQEEKENYTKIANEKRAKGKRNYTIIATVDTASLFFV